MYMNLDVNSSQNYMYTFVHCVTMATLNRIILYSLQFEQRDIIVIIVLLVAVLQTVISMVTYTVYAVHVLSTSSEFCFIIHICTMANE